MLPIQITITNANSNSWIELLKTAGPFVGGWVGAGIAGWLTIRAYRTNQWWDGRFKTYQKVVECLHDCEEACDRYHTWHFWQGDGILRDEELGNASDKFLKARERLGGLIGQSRFTMSDQARALLVGMMKAIKDEQKKTSEYWFLLHEIQGIVQKTMIVFTAVAKKDLQVFPIHQLVRDGAWWLIGGAHRAFVWAWIKGTRFCCIVWFGESVGRQRHESAVTTENYGQRRRQAFKNQPAVTDV